MNDTDYTGTSFDGRLWLALWRYARVYPAALAVMATAAVITAGCEIAYPLLTRWVIDSVEQGITRNQLWRAAALYAVITVIISLSICGFVRMGGLLQSRISHDVRRDGFARLQSLSFSYFDRRPVGWLMARMTSDCDRLSSVLVWGLLDTIWGLSMMIGIAIAMMILSPLLAGVVLVVMPVLLYASLFFQNRLLASARESARINSRVTASYNESINGVLTSKVFRRERYDHDQFNLLTGELSSARVQNMTYSALYQPLVVCLASLAIGLTLVAGGWSVLGGAISIGTLIAFMSFASNLFDPVEEISGRFAEMQTAQASAERVFGLINEVPEIFDDPDRIDRGGTDERITDIELRDVRFSYDADQSILDGINLHARAGQNIAIVGPTGGGKSSLIHVIARFLEPDSGEVLINGCDYRRYSLEWLQSRLGVILQDNPIFSGTLMDNIRYGRLEATDSEVIEASRLSGAHDFILRFNDGYATEAGERGSRLSSGQKQLLSIARAIVADPQILILDEATSSIDLATEAHIQRGLSTLREGRLSFTIAHRLSTIREADVIIVLDQGRIVQHGNHDELMGREGRYRAMHSARMSTP